MDKTVQDAAEMLEKHAVGITIARARALMEHAKRTLDVMKEDEKWTAILALLLHDADAKDPLFKLMRVGSFESGNVYLDVEALPFIELGLLTLRESALLERARLEVMEPTGKFNAFSVFPSPPPPS